MGWFKRLEINEKLWCESGAAASTKAILRPGDFAGEGPSEVLATDEQEGLTFQVPQYRRDGSVNVAATVRAQAIGRLVFRETKTAEYFREYRLRAPIAEGTLDRGVVSVRAEPILLDLGKCGLVRELSNGMPIYDFDLVERTAEEILDEYVVQKTGLAWLALGTVDPDYTFASFAFDRLTPLAVALLVRDQLRERDIACELRLEPNGVTNYQLKLLTQIGAGVDVAPFTIKGQLGVRRTHDLPQQANRVFVSGGADPDSQPGLLGRARWVAGNVTSTTFTLADPNGGSGPIVFADQYVGAASWSVYRVKTGETWPIVGTDPATQAVEVASTRNLQDGEHFEFRVNEPLTNPRYVPWSLFTQNQVERRVLEITAIDGGTKEITVAFPWVNGVPAVLGDGQFDGYRARLSVKVHGPATVQPNAGSDYYTLPAGLGTLQVDDWIVIGSSGTAPYNHPSVVTYPHVNIASLDGPNNRVHVVPRFQIGADPLTGGSNQAGARFYRELRIDRVRATTLSSSKLELDSVSGLSIGDVVELDQPDGAGEVPGYVEHPTAVQAPPVGVGVQAADVVKPLILGLQELGANPFCRQWSGGANDPPDLWSKTGAGTITRNTDLDFVKFGDKSVHVTDWSLVTLFSERFHASIAPGRATVSVRAWVYFTAFTTVSDTNQFHFKLYEANPDGTKAGAVLATVSLFAPDNGTVADEQKAALGVWMTMDITGIQLTLDRALWGFIGEFTVAGAASNNPITYIGGVEKYAHAALPDSATVFEFGDVHRLTQAGNRHLREFVDPKRYDAQLINWGALDPDRQAARQLDRAIGADVPLITHAMALNESFRLLRAEFQHFYPERTQCTFARKAPLLSDVITN